MSIADRDICDERRHGDGDRGERILSPAEEWASIWSDAMGAGNRERLGVSVEASCNRPSVTHDTVGMDLCIEISRGPGAAIDLAVALSTMAMSVLNHVSRNGEPDEE